MQGVLAKLCRRERREAPQEVVVLECAHVCTMCVCMCVFVCVCVSVSVCVCARV